MIKRRYGEEIHTKLSANLEVKANEVAKKQNKDNKRRPRGDRPDGKDRKPRENKDRKEGAKIEEETAQPPVPTEEKAAPVKRDGRKRGNRDGQE